MTPSTHRCRFPASVPVREAGALIVCALLSAPALAGPLSSAGWTEFPSGRLAAQEEVVGEADAPRTLTPDDYGQWESLGFSTLSDDGRWLVAPVSRVNGEDELRIHLVESAHDSTIVVEYGTRATFSDDGRWLAYSIGVSEDTREKLQKQKKPVRSDMGLVDLTTGTTDTVPDVASFAFSHDGRHLAMRRYPPKGDRGHEGVDLVVRELASGLDTNFGNVSEYAWQDEGGLLAMVVDAEGMAGNGVQAYDPVARRLTTLDSESTVYSGLEWRDESGDLAVMRRVSRDAEGEDRWLDTAEVVLAWEDLPGALDEGRPSPEVLEVAALEGFPEDHRIVSFQDLRWSDGGERLFFGVVERTPDPDWVPEEEGGEEPSGGEAGSGEEGEEGDVDEEGQEGEGDDEGDGEADEDEDPPTVQIWHAKDVDIFPRQKVTADRDRRDNHLAVWEVGTPEWHALETELTESVRFSDDHRWLVAMDQTPYEVDRMFGPVYNDVYLVDTETGERERVLERIQYVFGLSPEGRYLLYLIDDHYWTYDTETGEHVNITADVPTSFVDLEDDHTVEQKPPFGTAGWLDGDEAVLVNDEFDVWRVSPDGSGGERLTRGAEDRIRHRRTRLDFEEESVDPDEPQYFSVFGDRTKKYGYARADRVGSDVERLVWVDRNVGWLRKAEDAEVFTYRVQGFDDSPDYFVAGAELADARQVTETNPFQDDYLWGTSELVDFQNQWGDSLQGALYYPADYEPGKKYPMIVYIYEILSPSVHSYTVPSEESYYNTTVWTQDGYFVFRPDIVYRDRDPGVSAVASLEPAVQTMIETGMVDPDRVGLIGHSWGGYQTTFAVTQTDIFSGAVAGAPLTNLFSMYLSIYWNSGGTDARIFEISQGRMEVPFWEDEAAYRRNSPVFHIEEMATPLLMAQGTEDGAVDFNQGVEFYNAARRAGKDFVFLVYEGENHGFRQDPNQKDYHRRINEWFAHYLKGEPAPEWIETGVPFLEQEKMKEKKGKDDGGS